MREKLGKLLKIEHGYAFNSSKYVEKSNYRLVTLANFDESNNSFDIKDEKAKYTSEIPDEKFVLKEDDLILPLTEQVVGLLGNSAFIPSTTSFKYVLNQRVGKVSYFTNNIDKNYLHYLLATNSVKKQLEDRASGTKQRNISPKDVYDVTVDIPEIYEQKKIGRFLRSIEKKIELNNRINDNLQQLGEHIFSYWFKQFQFPNSSGKPYKESNGEMKWSDELKMLIPKQWEVKSLGDILIKNSMTVKIDNDIDTIDLSVMPSDSFSLNVINNSNNFTTNLFQMNEGDLLFGSIRPYLHKAGIAPLNGYVTGTVHSYRVRNDYDYNLALFILTSVDLFNYAVKVSSGTKMPVVSSDNLLNFKFPYSKEVSKLFSNIDIKSVVIKNIQQNISLQKQRDYLLPLLINGQISII